MIAKPSSTVRACGSTSIPHPRGGGVTRVLPELPAQLNDLHGRGSQLRAQLPDHRVALRQRTEHHSELLTQLGDGGGLVGHRAIINITSARSSRHAVIDLTSTYRLPKGWVGLARGGAHVLRDIGKVGNCQIGVSVHAVTDAASAAINWALFVPKSWDDTTTTDVDAVAWIRGDGNDARSPRTSVIGRNGGSPWTWQNDRMILVGDAARGNASASGHGASMAIEEAVTLAKCLRDVPGIEQAFGEYKRLRRGRTAAMMSRGRRQIGTKILLPGPGGRVLRDFLLARSCRNGDVTADSSLVADHRIDWEERVVAPRS